MIDLLVHIGFPKTATTSLQDNVFVELHERGHINYLGCVRFNKSKFSGKDITNELRKTYFGLKDDFDLSPFLIEGKLNVISDEKFTLPAFFVKTQHNSSAAPFSFIDTTLRNLKRKYNVSVLVSIRNQPDLMFSQFLQKYKYLYHFERVKDFSSFKKIVLNSSKGFEVYNIKGLLRQLLDVLDKKNIHISLFEQLKFGNKEYFTQLSKALNGVDEAYLEDLFAQKVLRERINRDSSVSVQYYKGAVPIVENFLEFQLRPVTVVNKLMNKLFISTSRRIPSMDENDRSEIQKEFSRDNKWFFQEMGIPYELGWEYGYIVT